MCNVTSVAKLQNGLVKWFGIDMNTDILGVVQCCKVGTVVSVATLQKGLVNGLGSTTISRL